MRTWIAGVLLGMVASWATASDKDWVDIKDSGELRALYSNKTFKGKDWMDRPWIGHFRADGHGMMLTQGMRIPRTWEVKGDDQVCVATSMGTNCLRFQRHRTRAGVHRSIHVTSEMKTEFVVEEGVPKF